MASVRIVFSRHYDIGFFGLERRHPFDSHKYSRAWKRLRQRLGRHTLRKLWLTPDRAPTRAELLAVHTEAYLRRLRGSTYVANALELPFLSKLPAWLLDWRVLRAMRWGTRGTVLAAQAAMSGGLAVNLSGGYDHAKRDKGEGFCIYSDIALAIHALRRDGALDPEDRVAYIDLDAHQGNGICHQFMDDARVQIFDMYNPRIYPNYDVEARDRVDWNIPLPAGCGDDEYLLLLTRQLPGFLETSAIPHKPRLAIYNAGTDVFAGDALGGLNLSTAGVLERDLFVVEELRRRNIPTVILPSGGYSSQSYLLIADSVEQFVRRYT